MLGFARGGPRDGWAHRLTETAVIATSLLFVVWETTITRITADHALDGLERTVLLAYPIGDLAVVTMALVAVLNRRSRAMELAAVAAIAMAVGNGVYSYHQTESTFRTGSLSDLLWLAGLALFVLAGLRPDAGDATTDHVDLAGRSLLGYGPTLAALGVGVWRLVDGSGYDGVRSALIAGIGVAILANQLTSYAENSALHRSLRPPAGRSGQERAAVPAGGGRPGPRRADRRRRHRRSPSPAGAPARCWACRRRSSWAAGRRSSVHPDDEAAGSSAPSPPCSAARPRAAP